MIGTHDEHQEKFAKQMLSLHRVSSFTQQAVREAKVRHEALPRLDSYICVESVSRYLLDLAFAIRSDYEQRNSGDDRFDRQFDGHCVDTIEADLARLSAHLRIRPLHKDD